MIAAERAAEAWAKLKKVMRSTVESTDAIKFTPEIEQGMLNKALGQTEKLHHSLTQINTEYAEMPELVIVSAEKIQEWSDQAYMASAHVAEGIYSIFDALEAEDFWTSLYRSARRYFQMLIAESVRSRAYAWFLSAFSGGNIGGTLKNPTVTGNPGLLDSPAGGGGVVNVTLVNNSGMPLEASASIGSGGSLEVVLEGTLKKMINGGRMDSTFKQNYSLFRTAG